MEAIAIYKDAHIVKCAFLKKSASSLSISKLFAMPLKDFEKNFPNKFTKKEREKAFIVSGLKSEDVLIRNLEIPFKKRRSIFATLPFQIENLLPYPIDSAITLPVIQKEKNSGTKAIIFSCLKEKLKEHLMAFNSINIDPDWVSFDAAALSRYADFIAPKGVMLVHFHFGEESSLLSLNKDGKLLKCTSFASSNTSLYRAFQKDFSEKEPYSRLKKLQFSYLEREKTPHLFEWAETFYQQLDRSLYFLLSNQKQKEELSSFLSTGGEHGFLRIGQYLGKSLEKEIKEIQPKASLLKSFPAIGQFAVPVGLSLDVLSKDKRSLQFRSGSFFPKKLKKRLKRNVLKSFCAIFLLTVTTFLFSHFLLMREKKIFFEEMRPFITQLPNEISSKTSNWETANAKEILKNIEKIKDEMAGKKQQHFVNNLPFLVSDVFAFLSKNENNGIDIKKFHYALEQHPSLKQPFEKNRVKVEIDFAANSQDEARAFHDFVLSEKALVDTKKDIYWNRSEHGYQISFFLKNR